MMKNISLIVSFLFVFWNCAKEISENPFDTVDITVKDSIDLTNFAGLHQHILEPRCANPACHDGTFEPDFRTVESSYNTLVYQPVIKNDQAGSFEYRVVPGDVNASWLINRLMTTNDTLGQMPLYSEPLSWNEVSLFSNWIIDGARNAQGDLPEAPNKMPNLHWYVAFDGEIDWTNWKKTRVDTTREEWHLPFVTEANDTLLFLFNMSDDLIETNQLTDFKVHFYSDHTYTNPTTFDASFYTQNYWRLMLPPNVFTAGDTVYFNCTFSDGVNLAAEPSTSAAWWSKDHSSFYLD